MGGRLAVVLTLLGAGMASPAGGQVASAGPVEGGSQEELEASAAVGAGAGDAAELAPVVPGAPRLAARPYGPVLEVEGRVLVPGVAEAVADDSLVPDSAPFALGGPDDRPGSGDRATAGTAGPAPDDTDYAAPVDLLAERTASGTWTLEQLIDRAVRMNPRVLAQQAGLAVARAGEAAARWEYFPNPQVQVEGTPHDHQINTIVTQPLYAFGRLGSGLASARAQGAVAGHRADEARHDIALRVLDLYGQFATQTREIAVLDSDIARHLALEAMIHRRVEAGVSAPVDLNLVQTRLNQSRISRTALRSRLRTTLTALSEVVGVMLEPGAVRVPGVETPATGTPASEAAGAVAPGAATPDPAGPAPGQDFLADQASAAELVQRCLDRNPSLQRADAEVVAAQAEARRARSVVFPTIAARFENRSRTSLYPSSGLPDTRLTIGFTIATGSGLASLANVQAADGRIRAAIQAREALRQDVTTTVIAALESFGSARRSVAGLRQSQAVQQQTADSYNRMFLAGKRSWLDLLNMVREQSGIERDLADAEVQLMIADYRLRIEAGEPA